MPGLTGPLNQRFRIYRYAATDTDADGVMSETYTYEATRWGRLEPPSGREITMGAAERERVDGVLTMKAEVLSSPGLSARWMIKTQGAGGWSSIGGWWRILTVLPRRGQQVVQALVQWGDDAQTPTVVS